MLKQHMDRPQPIFKRAIMGYSQIIEYIQINHALKISDSQRYWEWISKYWKYVHKGGVQYWNLAGIIQDANTPFWVKKITRMIHQDFIDLCDEDGGFEVITNW